eukprot:scaffold23547_cov129-Isochrysis_galbana.AAC.3
MAGKRGVRRCVKRAGGSVQSTAAGCECAHSGCEWAAVHGGWARVGAQACACGQARACAEYARARVAALILRVCFRFDRGALSFRARACLVQHGRASSAARSLRRASSRNTAVSVRSRA